MLLLGTEETRPRKCHESHHHEQSGTDSFVPSLFEGPSRNNVDEECKMVRVRLVGAPGTDIYISSC